MAAELVFEPDSVGALISQSLGYRFTASLLGYLGGEITAETSLLTGISTESKLDFFVTKLGLGTGIIGVLANLMTASLLTE